MLDNPKNLLCFETIKIYDNQAFNLDFHNARLNNTRKSLFGSKSDLDINDYIQDKTCDISELSKCKITYDNDILDINITPYTPKNINTFKIVYDEDISYDYKYIDRKLIDNLYSKRDNCDEIIIIKDGLVTDTSIANIAIYVDGSWLTPKKPLLDGTFKQKLIKSDFLQEYDINIDILMSCSRFAVMNAMVGFTEIENYTIIQ